MTEDRLTHLLSEATDLAPSAELQERVIPSPQPLSPRGERDRRRLPWFALSGATAALAVLAFLAIPREVSAAKLIQGADQAVRENLTYRAENERFVAGHWQAVSTTLSAPGWMLRRDRDGAFMLHTPKALYRRLEPTGSILLSHPVEPYGIPGVRENDPSPENYVRFLQGLGRLANRGRTTSVQAHPPIRLGTVHEDGGRRLREVFVGDRGERARFLLDADTSLPVLKEIQRQQGSMWQDYSRSRYVFPGATPGSAPFTDVLGEGPLVDVDPLTKAWELKFTPVIRTLRPTQGKRLDLRDLRTLPCGDVLVLYTGPERVSARLEGAHGEPFGTCFFTPNKGYERPPNAPPLLPGGKYLRGLRFVPLHADRPISGPYRLRLYQSSLVLIPDTLKLKPPSTPPDRTIGEFQVSAPFQTAPTPPWADAVDGKWFGRRGRFMQAGARISTLADTWLDAQGRTILGSYGRDALNGWNSLGDTSPAPPAGAVRHDPQSCVKAGRILREFITASAREGIEQREPWVSRLLAKLDRWAKGG